MTVSYTAEVATCHRFGCFWKLLARWRASIYKIIWVDLVAFLASFYAMAMLYRIGLSDDSKKYFEDVVEYCHSYGALIPLSFVLGFYVAIVVERWWSQYITVPWPDPLAVYVSALVRGQDEHGRLMRRTIMRYVCLALTMVLTMISPGIKRRFPTPDYLIDAGLLNKNEANIIKAMDEKFPKHPKHWMPIMWASSIVTRARKEGRIWDDFSLKSMIDELNKFRAGCNMLIHYDTISVPLVYTQVVTLAVYAYFLAAIFGHQWIDKQGQSDYKNIVNYYFPLFSTLEFFFFMGWLKVAETLICPFGDDDDDFDLNWLIDRNLQVSYLIVDEMHNDHPQLVRDQYWDEVFPNELPYQGEVPRAEHPEASTAKLDLSKITNTSTHNRTVDRASDDLDIVDYAYENEEESAELRIRFAPRPFRFSRSSLSMSISSDFEKYETPIEEDLLITDMDDFDRLRTERERARIARQMQNTALALDLMKNELGDLSGSPTPTLTAEEEQSEESVRETAIQTDKSYMNRRKRP